MESSPSFFESSSARPPFERPPWQWAAPVWDRPSEGTVPVAVPVNELVFQGPNAVVAIDCLRVYRNGFTVGLFALADPRIEPGPTHPIRSATRFPRVGVRFADGRTAGQADDIRSPAELPKDDRGVPIDPVVRYTGGSGGRSTFQTAVWVHPLPPDGPLEIFVGVTDAAGHSHETRVEVDGAAVRAAAERARVIWE
jgi:hypothetical protein